ncbi:MAG: 16S rRNA (guanine(527)-N(7))-methyltransferase RsmG [Bacteroidota bacterium]
MSTTDPRIELRTICRRENLLLTDGELDQLAAYVDALLDWNKRVNLISRRDVENIWFSQILHCLSLLFYVDLPDGLQVLDLGSGGGLPGIPLAISRPGLRVTLLDSIRKKTQAVKSIRDTLGLANVNVVMARAEEWGARLKPAERFDLVIARAVAPLADIVRWARPLLRSGFTPQLIAYKGGDLSAEVAQAKLKGRVSSIKEVPVAFEGSLEIGLEEKKLVLVNF